MNKQELIKKYKELENRTFDIAALVVCQLILIDLEQLDKAGKVKIPQFVADWIEKCKAEGKRLLTALLYTPEKVNSWVDNLENQELFAHAWILGYEVEEENRYYIRLKGVDENYNYLNFIKHLNAWVLAEIKKDKKFRTTHTRKELEEAGFGWVFSCEGIEIEEVK